MKIRMGFVASLCAALLSACVSALPTAPLDPKHIDQATKFVGPNGGTAFLMQCFDGVGCYQRAREACANGYTIFDSIDNVSGSTTNGSGFVASSHYIAFECK